MWLLSWFSQSEARKQLLQWKMEPIRRMPATLRFHHSGALLIIGIGNRLSNSWKYCFHVNGTNTMASCSSELSRQWKTDSISKNHQIQTVRDCNHCCRLYNYLPIYLQSNWILARMERLPHEAWTVFLRLWYGLNDCLSVYLDNRAPRIDAGTWVGKVKPERKW